MTINLFKTENYYSLTQHHGEDTQHKRPTADYTLMRRTIEISTAHQDIISFDSKCAMDSDLS